MATVVDWIRRHWRKLLVFLGVSGLVDLIFDLIKDYAGSRLMDWAVAWLGPFGYWLVANPVALFTLVVGVILIFLAVGAVQLATTTDSSTILDPSSRPFPRSESQSTKWTVGFVAAIILIVIGVAYGARRYYVRSTAIGRPSPPTGLRVKTETQFQEPEGRVLLSPAVTSCIPKGGRVYQWVDFGTLPGGPNLKRPMLLPKPEAVVYQGTSDDPNLELLLEVTVISRGEATIAQHWTLCLVHEGKPSRYRAAEITPELKFAFGDRVSLADLTVNNPIEHGRAAVGWLLFRVPREVVGTEVLTGSIECRDYLEHRYVTSFGGPASPTKGGLSDVVK